MMTPNELSKFRGDTRNHAKTAGLMLWNKKCQKCKLSKRVGGGRNKKVGKISYFTCAECL